MLYQIFPKKQKEIIRVLLKARKNLRTKEIAFRLNANYHTTKNHLRLAKITAGADTNAELIEFYRRINR